jgi:dihydrolipoamide dehydrogenase
MQYDILIIGSGPGGYKAAVTAAFMGAKVALVEKHVPGGNCLNQGCVPTKTLVHLAELLEDVGALQSHAISAPPSNIKIKSSKIFARISRFG